MIEFDDFYAIIASEVIEIVEASVRFNGDIILGWMKANQATSTYGIVAVD
ncbi:hypothetical protein [Photobacterium aquae]|nr:hypothetical protein [Photobacterium aquae]